MSKAVEREVRAVFAPDRLARERLERVYARLAPGLARRAGRSAPPAPRGAGAATRPGAAR